MVTPGFPLGQPPHERGRLSSVRSWHISRAIPRVASIQTVAVNTRVFLSRHMLKQQSQLLWRSRGQKAWQKITAADTGGRTHGPDLSPSRESWPPSYSNLKRGINHSSEIPNGGMQDAFLSERTLCIHIDGLYMAV
jgi:hypothetical protein